MDAKEKIENLTNALIEYQNKYYKEGNSPVSDAEYDRLFDELSLLEKENPEYSLPYSPTKRVGSDLTNDFPEVKHTIPVLSLDKAYTKEEVLSFFDKSIKKKGGKLSFVAEEKIDGISMVLYYENGKFKRAVTRGNGSVGNDVSANIATLSSIPLVLPETLDIAVRGEVYLSKKDFEEVNKKLPPEEKASNARNLTAGTIRRLKSEETGRIPLNIFCYEGFWKDASKTPKTHLEILKKLEELGFRTNKDISYFSLTKEESINKLNEFNIDADGYSFSEIEDYIHKMTEERESLPHEIDGLVFKINELDVREEMGYTEHHPRWAIAYKFTSPSAITKLKGISIQVGRTGRITPVAEVENVSLNGSVIKRATLHNQEYIDELELALGDTVSISKRGDVIPAVEEVLEKNSDGNTTYKIPLSCPSCGEKLIKKGAHLFCPNAECRERRIGAITFFSSRDQMDIENLGRKTVETFYDRGIIKRIEDIYHINWVSLPDMEGFGKKSIDALIKGIEESKDKSFSIVLSSLGIPEFGKRSAEMLIKGGFTSFEELREVARNNDTQSLTKIDGIGDEMALSIIETFRDEDFLNTLDNLISSGLHSSTSEDKKEEEVYSEIFKDQIWCVTGSFINFNPREKALSEIEKRGGKTTSSITGKTTHLLCGKGGGGKREEALKRGVKLINEDEFISLIGLEQEDNNGGLFS